MTTMEESALLIRVDIEQEEDWYFATSKDLPGLVLVDQDESELMEDLPRAIKLLIGVRYDVDCRVLPTKFGKEKSKADRAWFVAPAGIGNISIPMATA